jgi:hypothetical protein
MLENGFKATQVSGTAGAETPSDLSHRTPGIVGSAKEEGRHHPALFSKP